VIGKRWTLRRVILVAVGVVVGIPVLLIGFVVLYLAAWFHAGALYSGDGEYRRGVGETAFQVAFPPIDISKTGRHRYKFTRLGPSLNYAVGLRFMDSQKRPVQMDEYGRPDLKVSQRPGAVVAVALTNERHEQVFSHKRRLTEWSWLRNMAEIDEKIIEVPIGGGSVRIERVGVGPDDGWGTHFTPRWFGKYELEIQVVEADKQAAALPATPVIEGYVAWP
jgi:hypothetical protein